MITDTPNCTDPDRMKGIDIAGALGMTEQHAKFGISVFFAKNAVSEEDKFSTVEQLTQYALKNTPKLVAKSAGNKLGYCLVLLAKIAFEDYARSAGSICECFVCGGKGLVFSRKDVVKYQGKTSIDGVTVIEPRIEKEKVGELCKACNGKGKLTYRCRCKGRGKVLDEKQTELQGGIPVFKDCPRCSGRGYKRMPSSVAYQAISKLLPELNERTWRRNWKPFYESLVNKCFIEERRAEQIFIGLVK